MQHPQGGDDVGDLGDGEQPAQADHLDRHPTLLDRSAQQRELGALAAEHGDVGRLDGEAVPGLAVGREPGRDGDQVCDLFRHPAGFGGGGFQQGAHDRAAPRPARRRHQPGHLGHLIPQVPLDHRGDVEHLSGVAEAGGELGDLGRVRPGRELAGEPGQIARAGPAPAVDRLARVAYGGHRMPAAEQRPQQHHLGVAGVLELVQEDDLVAGALDRAYLAVPGRDPGGQRHLVRCRRTRAAATAPGCAGSPASSGPRWAAGRAAPGRLPPASRRSGRGRPGWPSAQRVPRRGQARRRSPSAGTSAPRPSARRRRPPPGPPSATPPPG